MNNEILDIRDLILKAYYAGRKLYTNKKINIFTKEKFIELFAADILGHNWNPEGKEIADAWEQDGSPTEYKSRDINSSNGIQFCGIDKNGIEKFKNHKHLYLINKTGPIIEEIYKFNMHDIIIEMIKIYGNNHKKKQINISIKRLFKLSNIQVFGINK